jgi:hypothetical protein
MHDDRYYHPSDLAKFPHIGTNCSLLADLDQMTEAVHVAAAIRGGATLFHGVWRFSS